MHTLTQEQADELNTAERLLASLCEEKEQLESVLKEHYEFVPGADEAQPPVKAWVSGRAFTPAERARWVELGELIWDAEEVAEETQRKLACFV